MKIGVLTSGGDAPGMNAALRAVVRTAVYNDIPIYGINNGYAGLLEKDIIPLTVFSVANIIQQGGTILKSSRSEFFQTVTGQKTAVRILSEYGIDHLVVIGGDGSLKGALALKELGINVMGIPATIDNDFGASDFTIGFDTAVNTAIDAISKIRDTTYSHNRINVVQVMGRKCGDIALYSGFSVGAEVVIIPEVPYDPEEVCNTLLRGKERGKMHNIVMLAEGRGSYRDYIGAIEKQTRVSTRGTNLGYIQRGGSPSHYDRNLAGNMGYHAVEAIVKNQSGGVIVKQNGNYVNMPLEEALEVPKAFNKDLYEKIKILSI